MLLFPWHRVPVDRWKWPGESPLFPVETRSGLRLIPLSAALSCQQFLPPKLLQTDFSKTPTDPRCTGGQNLAFGSGCAASFRRSRPYRAFGPNEQLQGRKRHPVPTGHDFAVGHFVSGSVPTVTVIELHCLRQFRSIPLQASLRSANSQAVTLGTMSISLMFCLSSFITALVCSSSSLMPRATMRSS